MAEDLLTITFGLFKDENSRVETYLNWKLEKDDVGVFMVKTEKQLSQFDKIIVKKNEEMIWASNIRLAPEKNLELPYSTSEENIYISAKPIRATELPFGDNIYDIILISREEEIGRGVIMIDERREEEDKDTKQAKIYDIEDILSKQESGQEVQENQVEPTQFKQRLEECKTESQSRQEPDSQSETKAESEGEIKEAEQIKDVISEKFDDNKAMKTKLIEILSKFEPVSVSLKSSEGSHLVDYSKNDIIIEKTGNSYITVLNNFFGRANYLLRDEERVICWENSFENYMEWLKNILIKKYNLQLEDLNDLGILVISDDEDQVIDQEKNKLRLVSRRTVIESIGKRSGQVVDLKDDCSIYVEIEGKALYINFEESRLKNALDFLENEPTLLIGVTPDKLVDGQLLEDLKENKEVKITNLAWEASIIE